MMTPRRHGRSLRLLIAALWLAGIAGLLPRTAIAAGTTATNLPVAFTATGPCQVGTGSLQTDGTTTAHVTLSGAGDCTVKASQGGNATYAAAEPVSRSFMVAPAPTTLTLGAVASTPYRDALALSAAVAPTSVGGSAATGTVVFSIDGTTVGSALVNSSGVAATSVTVTQAAGPHAVTAVFTSSNPNLAGSATSSSSTLSVTTEDVTLGYTGDTSGDYHDSVTMRAVLLEDGDTAKPIGGKNIAFTLGSQSCSGITTSLGVASCSLTLSQDPASVTAVTASFPGDASYAAGNSGQIAFTGRKEETGVSYSGATQFAAGSTPTVTALLQEDGTTPLAGKVVRIRLGTSATAPSCTGMTGVNGVASCMLPPLSAALGDALVSVAFAGDARYLPADDASQHAVVYGSVAKGAFVLGDKTAQAVAGTGTPITYWGPSWSKANSLSGGTPPSSFFGFARSLSRVPPVCGSTWTTSPGASSITPPITPPAYMAVLLASRITQAGSVISGNIVKIAIVKTGPGGLGTGTVLSTFCPASGSVMVRRHTAPRPAGQTHRAAAQHVGHRSVQHWRHEGAIIPTTRVRGSGGHSTGLRLFHPAIRTASAGTKPQQISFDPIPDHTFGDTPFSISAESVTTPVQTGGLPPDPSTVAPPIDGTVATTIGTATAFLYSGDNPIQTGVAPGTVNPIRACVLRGTVLDKDGNPLSGVTITILNRPELGETLSRVDGRFDLAVNGGGYLTVNYAKDGYFSVQRQITTPWQDYAALPEVVMIARDSQATAIDLTSSDPIQVAQGSQMTDADGTRQATLLFPQGTTAAMTLPDGSTQPLTTLHVRATEFTVGPNGPEAMPGTLPPTSGYTYAVNFSVDEAQAAGATSVQFNHPIISYLQNFLNFPVGMTMPVGSYNASQGKWIPEDNGRVIKILSITNGMADLDLNGSGQAADSTALAALGITDAERTQLASLYTAGDTLWRTPIAHFTPFDCNAPYGPPPDALPPNNPNPDGPNGPDGAPNPQNPHPPAGGPDPDPCNAGGSIIGCMAQSLGEDVPITGTSFSLHYQSDRSAARTSAYTVHIPLTGNSMPPGVLRVDLEIRVAGRLFTQTFSPALNQSYTFTWDGRDTYGRFVQGSQQYEVRVGYVYRAVYMLPAGENRVFAGLSGIPLTSSRENLEYTLWQVTHGLIGTWREIAGGLGGWSLNVHHGYDPNSGTLYLGNGVTRDSESLAFTGSTMHRVAGGNANCLPQVNACGDGGPARLASVSPSNLAVDAVGDVYIVDFDTSQVRKVDANGIITTIAGTGTLCAASTDPCGDGGPAVQAQLKHPAGVAVGPDGSVYIVDADDYRIRRVSPAGIITTVAGTGVEGFGGDGGPATQAQLDVHWWSGISVGPDGSLFIGDTNNNRIRRVAPDGTISTAVGDGSPNCPFASPTSSDCFGGDAGPASKAHLSGPTGVLATPDGVLYVADTDNLRIRRVGPDGRINTLAGSGNRCLDWFTLPSCGDGGQATQALFSVPRQLAPGPNGTVYIADAGLASVRWVEANGSIVTVAGGPVTGPHSGPREGSPTTPGSVAGGIAARPDGALYLPYQDAVWATLPVLGSIQPGQRVIPSVDGSQLYLFDSAGHHERTLDGLTNATLYQFGYDAHGFLSTVTDGGGNVTTIERDASDNPTAIVAPGGQRTTFTIDANGYFASIADPAGDTYRLGTTADGALTTFTDPNGQQHIFQYDAAGRLIKDQNPAGGSSTLVRTNANDGTGDYSVALTTAIGRTTTYAVEFLDAGGRRFTKTDPSGGKTVSTLGVNGVTTTTYPDGTTAVLQQGPDPRWGMLAPVLSRETITTPAGLVYTEKETRQASLSNPDDPFSVLQLVEGFTVNSSFWTTSYTAANHQVVTTSSVGHQDTQTLDAHGRPIQDQIGTLTPTQYGYDSNGRLTTVTRGTRVSTTTYDAAGNISSETDPLGRTVHFSHDLGGRITAQTGPDGTSVTSTGYDAAGNPTSITTPAGSTHSFGYSPVNLPTSYTPPSVGSNTSFGFSLNADSQLTQLSRPDGNNVSLTYDAGGRLSTIATPAGPTSYSYDSATGALTGITTPDGGSLTSTFDGTLPTSVTWGGTVSGSVASTYNSDFRVASTSVNGGTPLAVTYDTDGHQIVDGAESLTYNSSNGEFRGTTLGGYSDSYRYSLLGELTGHTALYQSQSGPVTLFDDSFTLDALGRTTQKVETIAGATHTYGYTYDADGRLTGVTLDGNPSEQYTYDANGNRLTVGTTTASYDSQDRLVTSGTSSFVYNAAGELRSVTDASTGNTTTYAHDALGSLTGATLPDGRHITYILDGRNRRIGKTVNGALTQGFLYGDDLHPVAELDGNNAVVSQFVYGAIGVVPDYMVKAGVTYRIVSDEVGSVRLVVNVATGQVVQRMDYDAFGRVTSDTNPGFQPFGYGGGIYDRDTGLVHFGSRDYDAATGRWISKDPKGFGGGDTNLYAFVGNDPVNRIDPDGRDPLIKVPELPNSTPAAPLNIGDYKGTIGPFSYDPNAQPGSAQADAMSKNADREKAGGPDPLACKSHPGEPDYPNPLGPAVDDATNRLKTLLLPSLFPPGPVAPAPTGPAPWVPHGADHPYPLTNPAPAVPPICLTVGCK